MLLGATRFIASLACSVTGHEPKYASEHNTGHLYLTWVQLWLSLTVRSASKQQSSFMLQMLIGSDIDFANSCTRPSICT